MESIKLVIWDLDETFWGGTLSEGPIDYRACHHEMVVELTRRGIVNSISSKNDFDAVRAVLVERGLWDYFVFPKIDWMPKGEKIARTLEEMGLRAPNVLFVDDNPQNLEEAKFYSPGLQTGGPEILANLLEQPAARGKNDAELSRLKQYQLLEKKVGDRAQFNSGNEDFLRQCDIRLEIRNDCDAVFDRLFEMIGRTNQLNFTKQRLEPDSLRGLISDPQHRCGYVTVRDRYGDYGIAGFYALADQRLEHFLFSCRILNMGVEQWIYDRLGRPELTVVGDTSDDPKRLPVPDWIRLASSDESGPLAVPSVNGKGLTMLLKGGCDLEQVIDFLGRIGNVEGEFTYVTKQGAPAHVDHLEILKRCGTDVAQRFAGELGQLPFLDANAYQSRMLTGHYDIYIYSALMNMTSGLYRFGNTDWVIPFGDLKLDITDDSRWDLILSRNPSFTHDFLKWFRDRFTFEGGLSEEAFRQDLEWLCRQIPPDRQLILLNGAEIDLEHVYETGRREHHRRMNAVLAEVAARHTNVDVCDVRKFAQSPGDVTNNVRHYRRRVYHRIAAEIGELITRRWSLTTHPAIVRLQHTMTIVSRFTKNMVWSAMKRIRGNRRRSVPNREA